MPIKTYLVGGAVRDELLGLEPVERDWVVTGATPDHLEKRGFRQVGSSFPVFLHPRTGEEYALARTERKQGHGYHGFSVDFDPSVTIEQDLQRRDLTVNAMARDEDGKLVDPWGGQSDLDQRILRHVSPAFAEDPLRVLRVARFAARFAGLGFRIDPGTMDLMRDIVASGEIAHLVPERCWSEIRRAMGEQTPSIFLSVLRECGALSEMIPELDTLYGVPQSPEFHPEVDTGLHTEMAIDAAARDGCDADTVFAVLLHDLGKGLTPQSLLPAHHGHEKAGLPLVDAVCERLRVPNSVHRLCRQVSAWHLRCHRLGEMTPKKVMKLLEDLDAFRSRTVTQFTRACAADQRGRTGREQADYPQAAMLESALEAALEVRAANLDPDLQGPQLGEALRAARIEAIAELGLEPGK